jgi:hypothetical protein
MTIASGGAVTFSQVPVFPNNTVESADIQADAITGAKIADDAINSEHYTDGSIDTAHIADAQITTAKLATAVLTGATDIGAAIADADLFLVDDGAGGTLRKTAASRIKTYIGGSPMTLISTNTLSSAVASVSVSGMNSTYKNYKIIVSGLVLAQDNINLNARSITGGSINTDDYHNTEYSRHENGVQEAGRVINNARWTFLGPDSNVTGNASGENANLEMTIFDPSSTALRCMISSKAVFQTDQRTPSFTATSAFYDTTDALQGINFIATSGDINAGTFKLYGIS